MCEYYNRDYPELGKRKGEMRIDNNDVEHFGVLIGDCEELETVSMLRSIQMIDGKEVLKESDAYKDRVEQANTFINWVNGDTEIKKITVDDIEDIKVFARWAIGAGYTLIDIKRNIMNDGKYYRTEDYIRMYGNDWYSPTVDWKPRSMLGVRENGQFILAVIEGGSNSSNKGANAKEQALIMRQLGAVQAVNLDGGGSSAFWKSGEGYKYEAEGRRIGSVVMVVELR
jgi:exopolysaccharide biosynthesis protein